jgi:hypothetical protein
VSRCEDNVKVRLEEVEFEGVDWIKLVLGMTE